MTALGTNSPYAIATQERPPVRETNRDGPVKDDPYPNWQPACRSPVPTRCNHDYEFRVSTDTPAGDSRRRSLHKQHGWLIGCVSLKSMTRRAFVAAIPLVGLGLSSAVCAQGAASAEQTGTLFENVRIFDGKSDALSVTMNVLVRGNTIENISEASIPTGHLSNTKVIAGGGRTLMPGLIDAHWHAMLIRVTPAQSFGDVGYVNLLAAAEATDTLMRGFTTVRDVGGPVFGLKTAIDEGIVRGPRIYPSGAVITVTSGHGDFRQLTDLPRTIGGMLHRMEQLGGAMVADSPDEVRLRTREQLMQGASQIKLTAGGGVSSPFSPVDVTTFTEAELRAAVEAAGNWGTYVGTHAFTPAAIRR